MNAHEETHWPEFASTFRDRRGFDPNPHDSQVKELFFWFSRGGADGARLDWLDAKGKPETFEDAPHAMVWCVMGEVGQRCLRAAIDSAMAREQWRDDVGDPDVHDKDPATLTREEAED